MYHNDRYMQKLFTKILVPVNFNRNTRWSVQKAVQLANKFGCDILLLHVQPPVSMVPSLYDAFFSGSFFPVSQETAKQKLKQLELLYKPALEKGLWINSAVLTGYWQPVIKEVIVSEQVDLVLIPRNHKRLSSAILHRVNINLLAEQTNCPIMTITRNLNASHLQNIVVPVFDTLPVKKLTMATYFSIDKECCIYLMGREDSDSRRRDKGLLLRAYRLLSDVGKMNIRCAIHNSEDNGNSTLNFARNVKANLIVVNPGKESRFRGWWNRLTGKYLPLESDIPVLTVSF